MKEEITDNLCAGAVLGLTTFGSPPKPEGEMSARLWAALDKQP
jgi:hypothetical protein